MFSRSSVGRFLGRTIFSRLGLRIFGVLLLLGLSIATLRFFVIRGGFVGKEEATPVVEPEKKGETTEVVKDPGAPTDTGGAPKPAPEEKTRADLRTNDLSFIFDEPFPEDFVRRPVPNDPARLSNRTRVDYLLEFSQYETTLWKDLKVWDSLDWHERAAFTGLSTAGPPSDSSKAARFYYGESELHFEAFLGFSARQGQSINNDWKISANLVKAWLRFRALVCQAEIGREIAHFNFTEKRMRDIVDSAVSKLGAAPAAPGSEWPNIPVNAANRSRLKTEFLALVRENLRKR